LISNSYKNIEIIIVDNDSKNNEWDILLNQYWKYTNITILLNKENRWFAGGCNDWINEAQKLWCDYYLLFNNDAVAKNWFMERLIEVAETDTSCWIIWPAITYYKSDTLRFAWWIIGEWTWIFRHQSKWKNKKILAWLKPYETEYVTGCCMMIKKQLLNEQWLLDEEYFAYYEEADYCYKARKTWRKCIVVPDVIIEHKKSASAWNAWSDKLSPTQAYLIARNGILFWKKNFFWTKKKIFLLNSIIFLTLKCLIYSNLFNVYKSHFKWIKNWILN
jgi:GT2 family glycosyltransferase